MAKEALLIINPVSGTRSKQGLVSRVEEMLGNHDIRVTARYTTAYGDATRFVEEALAQGNADMVISAGGDGTVNEIAGALSHSRVPLGILPLGSGNGLARTLGIPQDVNEALKIITAGYTMTCDRGIVNRLPFYCTFGIGLDAAVSEKFATLKHRGRTMYIRSLIKEFISYRSRLYALQIDGRVITEKALLIAVCNASQYGNNAYIAPKAKLADGLLDITVVHSGSPLSSMLVGVDMMTGYLDRNTSIQSFQVKEAVISRLDKGPVHLDGDPHVMGKTMHIKCDRNALKVFYSPKNMEFKPIVSPLRALIDDIRYDMLARIRELS